ncbi:hypothetical protein AB7M35_004253 [Amorphus suaedae]
MSDTIDVPEFNPLAVENVGVTLAVELLEQPLSKMPPPVRFDGAGIYALYYSGGHPAYSDLTKIDAGRCKFPIYIGKSTQESSKVGFRSAGNSKKSVMFNRLIQHAKSIEEAGNLDIEDFSCRFLIVNDAYIALGESVLIRLFRPAWNGMSFGSKVVGKHRMEGKVGLWDALHPGRSGRPEGESRAEEAAKIVAKRVSEIGQQNKDIVVQRMYDRVMKFV